MALRSLALLSFIVPYFISLSLATGSDSYDFIIIGGGTAGLALAVRLTENSNVTVLVLEAGEDPSTIEATNVPGLNLCATGTTLDWAFTAKNQPGLEDREITYHRGRCLGGSSSINGEAYFRGSASIYDRWEAEGNPGWGWESVYPLFQRSTHFVQLPHNNDSYTTYDPAAYDDGPIGVGHGGYETLASIGFVEACQAIDIPIVQDLNIGDGVGVTQGKATVGEGAVRSSAYTGYYLPNKNRPNLIVKTGSPVQQLLLSQSGNLAATGVVYLDEATSRLINVTASKEVILGAGVFQTPQLLMLSGIGPKEILASVNIEPMLINENIGQNMQDQPVFSLGVEALDGVSNNNLYYNIYNLQQAEAQYFNRSYSGRLSSPTGVTNAFQQLTDAQLQSLNLTILSQDGYVNQSHLEFVYTSLFYPFMPNQYYIPSAKKNYFSIGASLMTTTSRGSVALASSSAGDPPIIYLNYYDTEEDQTLAVFGFKEARKIIADPASQQFSTSAGEVSPGRRVQSDAEILDFIRNTTIPNWHACGTCRMLPLDKGGVVDSELRVYGVDGLRIVDASIFPVIPDANIQAAVCMVAEKAAEVIKVEYGL